MSSTTTVSLSLAAGLLALAGCAVLPGSQALDVQAQAVMKAAFRDQGIAKADRINQDLGQQACSTDLPLAPEQTKRIEAEALATIRPPTGGQYLGDWREGEKLAQNGRGMTWTDASAAAKDNGGNCYNCHQTQQGRDLLRHHRPEPVQLRQAARRRRSGQPGVEGDRRVHLGQVVEQQGLCGVFEHAALRPLQAARRGADPRHHGAAARSEVAGQPIEPERTRLRAGFVLICLSLIAES